MGKHTGTVVASLQQVKSTESDILEAGTRLMKSADGQTYVFDLFAVATLNRAVAISSAFHTLVNESNMVAAGALVRIHLDTALRYFASHLVEDWDAFAESVIRGTRIDKMKDRNGKYLTDRHLSTEFDKKVPGIHNLYERTCRYVHFSDVHTASVLDGRVDRKNCIVGIKISATDREISDDFYIDACNTFAQISRIIVDLVQSWIDYKIERYTQQPADEI